LQLFEDGIYEIRIEVGRNIYRIFTFFDDNKLVILLHGFQKKSHKKRHSRAIESRGKNKPINTKSIVVPPHAVGKKVIYRMRWFFRRPHDAIVRQRMSVIYHCLFCFRAIPTTRFEWLLLYRSYSYCHMDCMVTTIWVVWLLLYGSHGSEPEFLIRCPLAYLLFLEYCFLSTDYCSLITVS